MGSSRQQHRQEAGQSTSPFLKWPGGKRWLVAGHADFLPTSYNMYIEPFLGSGAVFFHLQPRRALLADLNEDLISVYRGIKKDWRKVRKALQMHQRQHGDRYYYQVRDRRPQTIVQRAARMIYLNRTCFNGIYRVNLSGVFNVPKGTKDSVLFDTDDFCAVAQLLKRARLQVSDFEPVIDQAQAGDLVFADPPYTIQHNHNAFIKYNEKLFSWQDQIRLADALERAWRRGAHIVATNANHECVRALYKTRGFTLDTASRFSSMAADAGHRGAFEELVIVGTGERIKHGARSSHPRLAAEHRRHAGQSH